MTDGSINRTQVNFNNFNRINQQTLFKNNEYMQSSSPPSSSLGLHSYMNNTQFNMMPLNNIINQSPKSNQNQIKSNHMNSQYSKQNNFNRNRFNNQIRNNNNKNDLIVNNLKSEENKQLFTNNYNKLQNQRPMNSISNQQNRQMVHSSTYNGINLNRIVLIFVKYFFYLFI